MEFILMLIIPFIDIFVHRLLYKINKGLYLDMYLPKNDADKIWEVIKNENIKS